MTETTVEKLRHAEAAEQKAAERKANGGHAGGAQDRPVRLDPRNPMQSARTFVERHFYARGSRILHRHRGAFYRYTGTHYALADEEGIKSEIWQFLETALQPKGEPFKPKKTHVTEIEAALSAVCALDSSIAPPAWLKGKRQPPEEYMAVANGLLHLPTGNLLPPSPDFFGLNASKASFDPLHRRRSIGPRSSMTSSQMTTRRMRRSRIASAIASARTPGSRKSS